MPIALSTTVRQSKNQVSCDFDDEVVILNLDRALYFGLNEVGAYIWQALEKPIPASEVCKVVRDRFEVEQPQCEADILNLLAELEEAGLIEITHPSS